MRIFVFRSRWRKWVESGFTVFSSLSAASLLAKSRILPVEALKTSIVPFLLREKALLTDIPGVCDNSSPKLQQSRNAPWCLFLNLIDPLFACFQQPCFKTCSSLSFQILEPSPGLSCHPHCWAAWTWKKKKWIVSISPSCTSAPAQPSPASPRRCRGRSDKKSRGSPVGSPGGHSGVILPESPGQPGFSFQSTATTQVC